MKQLTTLSIYFLAFLFFGQGVVFSQNEDITIQVFDSCPDVDEGRILLTVNEGSPYPPYQFNWTDIDGDPLLNEETMGVSLLEGLAPGQYCVTVTSVVSGCEASTCDMFVEAKQAPVIELESASCVCQGGHGMIDITVSGVDDPDYDFTWMGPGDEIEDPKVEDPIVFFEDGTYTVTVYEDNGGCSATLDVYVPQCNFILADYTQIAPDCNEEGTSTISLNVPAGMGLPPYEVIWTKLGEGLMKTEVSEDGTAALENVGAGEYCVTVLTDNGCEENICNLLVEELPAPTISSTVTPVTTGNDGAISLSVTGGTGPITYLWSNGGQASSIQGLAEGSYSVTVTHTNGDCTEVLNFDLDNCQGILDELTNNGIESAITPLSANGDNASIDVTVSAYYPGYGFTFTWMQEQQGGGFGTVHVGEDLDNAEPGVYWLIIQVDGCPHSSNHEFIICDYIVDVELDPVDCENLFIKIDEPGYNGYDYDWTPGLYGNGHITYAEYGTEYCVNITENSTGCSTYICITPELPPISLDAQVTKSTNGNENGSISVSVTGGVGPFSYAWQDDPEETGPDRTGLGPGTYCVRVTDACFNIEQLCVTIECEFGSNEVATNITPVDCFAEVLGSIQIIELPNVGTPTPSFYFQWTGPESFTASTQNIYNLESGSYSVTITEATTGCYTMANYYVPAEGRAPFQLEFDKYTDCHPVNNGSITANVVGGTNGPFTYQWGTLGVIPIQYLGNGPTITGVSHGWYQLYVEDDWGCSVSARVYLSRPKPPFRIEVTATPTTICSPDEPAVGEVEIVSGVVNGFPVTYDWYMDDPPTSYTSTSPINNNLTPGRWNVTATDAYGCEVYGVTEVDLTTLELSSEITEFCSESTIALQASGGKPPYSFLWGDGNTQQVRTGLQNNTYTVTVTDGDNCTAEGSYQVTNPNIQLLTSYDVEDNGCAAECNGEIELTLSLENPTSANVTWENNSHSLKRIMLCAGDYHVTITNGDCSEEHTITVGQASDGAFTPESVVIRNFGYNSNGGKARVQLSSPLFEYPGSFDVYHYDPQNPPPGNPPPPFETEFLFSETEYVDIPVIHSEVPTFYVVYNAPNGCKYYGNFPGPDICDDSVLDGFNFSPIEHVGNSQQSCGPGQNNSYDLTVYYHGPNFPYFVDISVVNPDQTETLVKTVKLEEGFDINDPNDNPIRVDGIPSGEIRFETYNLCDNFFNVSTHINCCEGILPCDEVTSTVTNLEGSGTAKINGPYFTITGNYVSCFDYCGGLEWWLSGNCSYVKFDIPGFTSNFNCWTGTVNISYGNGEMVTLEVVDEPNHYMDADRINSDDDDVLWKPDNPGTYPFVIEFIGSNGSASCTTTQYIDYYGSGNHNDIIGFQDVLQQGYPEEFYDAYSSIWKCGGCVPAGSQYVMQNDQGQCDNESSWTSHFFIYKPNDYSNPCEGGGWLNTYEFDADGNAVIQDIPVPANPAIVLGQWDEMHQVQPIWDSNENDWCSEYGFCLFDANIGPDPIYDVYVDMPLIVSWVNPASCESVDWGDPHSDNFNPCGEENECSDGLICYEGSCYSPCIEGECQTGECVDVIINGETVSLCLPEAGSTDCVPTCEDDEECFEGYCYPAEEVDICDYEETLNGEGNQTVFFYHDLPVGTTIIFKYNTFHQPDEFFITGSGLNEHIKCDEEGQDGPQTVNYTITEPPPNVIAVTGVSCTEAHSLFWVKIRCEYFDDDDPIHGLIAPPSNGGIHEVSAFPNPFTSKIDIAVPDVQEPFEGEIQLVDPFGSVVTSRVHFFNKGLNNMSMEGLSDLAGGLYIVLIKKDGGIYASDKMIKTE
ncbi:MAG: hypothetical protein AAFZ15_32455 [Bacteroidota bacterium]